MEAPTQSVLTLTKVIGDKRLATEKIAVHDSCKNKFFKNRPPRTSRPDNDIHMLQGSYKKWIDSITKETIVSYSVNYNKTEQKDKLDRPYFLPSSSSSSSSSTDIDKKKTVQEKTKVTKCCAQLHLSFCHSSQTSKGGVRKSEKITMMSGPRPQTIRKKMEMELKLAEKLKKKSKSSPVTPKSTANSPK